MTVLLVAANGGHLAQLVDLAPRIDVVTGDRLWLTPPGVQSDALLRDEDVVAAPPMAERDLAGLARTAAVAAGLLRRHRIDAVVSTGSGIALGVFPLAIARRVPSYFIESATFGRDPSVSGRLLQRLPGMELFTQHRSAARPRWRFRGSVFDGLEAMAADGPDARSAPRLRRMVVTLGSDRWPFRRLVERVRSIIPDGVDVLWQTGPTPVEDLGIDAHRYVPAGELAIAMAEADVVVSHGGCGSALMALRAGRVPVLVARDPLHGEVVDGHQRPFMHELAVQGLAVAREVDALSLDDLHDAASLGVRRRDDLPMLRLAR